MIFARSPVGLAFHDLEGRYLRINDRLAEINGCPPEAHIGRTLAEVLPELPEVRDDVRRVAETGIPRPGWRCAARRPRSQAANVSGSRRTGPCARATAAS